MNTAMLIKPKSQVSYLFSDMDAHEGLREFIKTGFTAIPVIDREGLYIGVVSERDFLYRILDADNTGSDAADGITLGDLASVSRFETVQIDADYATLFKKIISQNFIPVIDSRGMFSGIVTRHDVLIALEPTSRNIT
ncbi:MAG: CBS domain-containing protein [Oscillospiraceae bacterium]|nr:CBS domain-containing protein [Oscillospiraceae bacterium]MBQ8979075.1 CBS domain-containing protein [Oscillospiraceae bacterium]